jgi:hypothetical protein
MTGRDLLATQALAHLLAQPSCLNSNLLCDMTFAQHTKRLLELGMLVSGIIQLLMQL